jgi:hypothetical protein
LHDWNDDLLAIARENIEPMLKSLREKCKSALEVKGVEHLSKILEEFSNMLQSKSSLHDIKITLLKLFLDDPRYEVAGAGAVFQSSLQPRKIQIARSCAEIGNELDRSMMYISQTFYCQPYQTDHTSRMIHDKATSAGGTGWFPMAMQPIWEKTAQLKKKKKSNVQVPPNINITIHNLTSLLAQI